MDRKHAFFILFWLCYVYGIENKDIFPSKYSVVTPQLIRRWTRSVNRPTQSPENDEEESISYALNINNTKHIIHLQKNRDFLHPNFVQFTRDAGGNYDSSYPKQHVHCFYHGQVEGYEDSVVALSTCFGLRGVIIIGNETYGLEPVQQSETNDHLLYPLKDDQSEPFTCGVAREAASEQSYEPFEPSQSLTKLLRRKRNLPQTSYVELVLVVDKLRYDLKKGNQTAIRQEMVEIANLLDGYYKQLNIRVVLVGLEIFKDKNPFKDDGTAGEVLGEFVKWRKKFLLPRIRHDMAQLVVGRSGPYGNILGMAFVGTVCSVATSGGINVFSNDKVPYFSTVVAHEMGHNLGMNHDNNRCDCNGESCIMGESASGSTKFSTCSGQDFENLIIRGGGVCLKNQPSPSDVIGPIECGNGRVDKGEECDCGTPEECQTDCCDAATCKFTRGSACAQGLCCDNCQIRVSGAECRASANTCDLPEFCNGTAAFCPDDHYLMDGMPCLNNAAYCYEGRCQTYDYQCEHLFADPARKADDTCFMHANTQGDKFGNCGFNSRQQPIKCKSENAMCGKLQCISVNLDDPPPGATVSITVVNGKRCINADFNLGSDVLDPAYVNPGSPCAKGKTCLDFECVNASALLPNLDCDARTTCNGWGVCNEKGNCHCDNGWAPPRCDEAGRGGSIDSNPAQIDHSLRDGLLIFFLLVVPLLILLILVLLYFFKREYLDPCLKRHNKSSNVQNGNSNQRSTQDVQRAASVQPPPQIPPDRPGYPPSTQLPTAYSYGELDYWNQDPALYPSSSPFVAQPPAHRQGPGVPRPIPPPN
ncbi:disintegrin and metalloproteinase domain-containing protein 9 [Notolabrus celidotus]|uniref:disintegrin and metalloproteinase domain-containing protein 9 n=1 Tax=Notolabrus celidotus TaxID=1203425 RepID=UPI00149043C9|nr:disintegrin and metalloproteinase domain-containing protein 9 [Notolabrus celidotus]